MGHAALQQPVHLFPCPELRLATSLFSSHTDCGTHLHPSIPVFPIVHKYLRLDRQAVDGLPVSLPAANPLIYRIITEIKSITETFAENRGRKPEFQSHIDRFVWSKGQAEKILYR